MTSAVDTRRDLNARLASVRTELAAQRRRLEAARSQLQVTMIRLQAARPQYELVRDTARASLEARLASEPVIEQAKGVVMARCRCAADEAFELLCCFSRSAKVTVGVVAARIVKEVAEGTPLPLPREPARLCRDGDPLLPLQRRRQSRKARRPLSSSGARPRADLSGIGS